MEFSCFCRLVVLVHLFILCVSVTHLHSLATDEAALLALKAHINPETQNILANNWTAATSVCNWIGVTCGGQPRRVTALNLPSMGLNGTLPPHIGNLSALSLFSINNNSFYGSLPNELSHLRSLKTIDFGINFFTGEIPVELGNLTMLNDLYLSYNNLEGTIPWEIGFLTNLKNLSISHNHLTGHIPSSIGNCSLLKEINFSGNNLTGAIPPEIGNLSNLEVLRVNNNILRGAIPSTVFNISTIQVILLYENHLSGNLPPIIGFFLPNLVELHLRGNELQGTIPSSISNASMLTLLDLTDNFFTGSIPNTIGNLRKLQRLELAHNHLTGESSTLKSNFISSLTDNWQLRRIVLSDNPLNIMLPTSIGNLSTSLEHFLVTDCKLTGIIPAKVGNLSSLIALELEKNELTGFIPNTIGRLEKLQGLHLQSNRLQGTILYDLCKLSSLVELFLGGNELSGSIPECLGNLTALRNISLGSNRLTSMIPSSLWSLQDILAINLSSNSLQGSLPLEIENLKVVTEIDLSRNQLSGYITSQIGNLQNLVYLSLKGNKLQGSIPESFGGSASLEFLDLSSNNLSGVIPKSLIKLFYLKYFNVSYNELQGEIPNEGPFSNFSAQSYLMNKALCGAERLQVPPCKTGTSRGMWRTFFHYVKIIFPVIASMYILLLIHLLVKRYSQKRMITAPTSTERRTILYLEIALATDGFSESNLIGAGAFASVYKGTMKEEKNVAIKVFNMHVERALSSFQVESELLSITHHPNIVKLVHCCCDDDFRALVLEYMPNGTLDKWLYTHNYFLNLLQRLDILIEVASALCYLHQIHVVHCDLKPSNVLLDEGMVAHVSDFSIAKRLGGVNAVVQMETMATVGYMAPEYGSSGIISQKTDVYSFGILLMEIFTGKNPTDEMFDGEMNLRRWVYESLPDSVNRVADIALLEADEEALAAKKICILSIMKLAWFCTSELPVERKTMREVEEALQRIKKKFLSDIEWSDQREIYLSISRQQLLLATDGFSESNIIEFGESSVIYKGVLPKDILLPKRNLAVKVFNRLKRGRESFAVESEVLSFIRHRNVVRISMMCNDIDFKALVLEYIPNGSLENWLHHFDNIRFMNVLTLVDIMIDVASALYYLHSMRVIHCNLKPSSVLLDDSLVAHVSDFGIAKRLGERIATTKTTTRGTAGYMAPEYESAGIVSEKTDVYSFGILLMEMFTRKKPTDDLFDGEMNLRSWICSSLPHALDQIVDVKFLWPDQERSASDNIRCIASIMEVACCCTAESADERMTMTKVETELTKIKRKLLSQRREV